MKLHVRPSRGMVKKLADHPFNPIGQFLPLDHSEVSHS